MKQKFLLLLLLTISRVYGQVIGIASPDLTEIVEFKNSFALRDVNGNLILSDIDSIGKSNKQDIYIVKKKNKYGIYSLNGKEVIPLQYDKLNRFFNQFWLAETNSKKEIYNIYTKKKLPSLFDEITFSNKVGMEFIVKKDDKYGIYNNELEEVVPIKYDNIKSGSIIELELDKEKEYLLNGKIIDKKIIQDKSFFIHGQYFGDGKTYYIFEKENKQGIIDDNDVIIINPKYDDITYKRMYGNKLIPSDILIVKEMNNKGMIDIENKILLPIQYQSIEFTDSDYLIAGINGIKQFYDFKNKKILEGIIFDKYNYLDKYSRIEKNGLETLIDNSTMKLLFPFKYENIIILEDSNFFSAKMNGKYGIIDRKENQVIPLVYDNFTIISCGNKVVVQKDGKYGIIDLKNNILLPFTDRYIEAYSSSFERRKENSYEMDVFDCNLKKIEKK